MIDSETGKWKQLIVELIASTALLQLTLVTNSEVRLRQLESSVLRSVEHRERATSRVLGKSFHRTQ